MSDEQRIAESRTKFSFEIVIRRNVEIYVDLSPEEAWERREELAAPYLPDNYSSVMYSVRPAEEEDA